jgi:hypothetical protein
VPVITLCMNKNRFAQFEERIQRLVEGGFARLFAGRLQPREVALRLARAMEDHADLDEAGLLVAPNRYTVHLHPDDHAALLAAQPDLAAVLARHVIDLAAESDLRLDDDPEIVLLPDATVAVHDFAVRASHVDAARQTTQMLAVQVDVEDAEGGESRDLPKAFLIVDGDRYVPLDRTVINVGRGRDSTIVIDDRRVSRQHCQLRFRMGQFVLYDLGSRGGTLVNGARVMETVLRSGDVISLAGVQVVYVVDETTVPRGDAQGNVSGDTQGYAPADPGVDAP